MRKRANIVQFRYKVFLADRLGSNVIILRIEKLKVQNIPEICWSQI